MKTIGSSSYLADHDGNISQFVCYTPYGETLVDEHLTGVDPVLHTGTYRTRYLFNGKELDTETNLYYYGARYFEPNITVWYGVDPLTEKYPQYSPYAYCGAQPIIARDENGEWINYVVGAVLGAAVEYGSQVASNLLSGESLSNALTNNIDVADIAIAAVEGALTSGGSVIKNAAVKTAVSVGAEIVSNAVDVNVSSNGVDVNVNDTKTVVKETAVGLTVGAVADSKAVKKVTDKVTPQVKVQSINKTRKEVLEKSANSGTRMTNKDAKAKAKSTIAQQKSVNETLRNTNSNITGRVIKATANTVAKSIADSEDK